MIKIGNQIGFYAFEDDYANLIQYIQDSGLLAIPEIISTDSDVHPIEPAQFILPEEQNFFYLIPDSISPAEAFYDELPDDPLESKLIVYTSTVIELVPCLQKNNLLYNGRLYLGLDENDRYYSIVSKKYNRLARYIRQWSKTDRFDFYVGPHTKKLALNEKIQLMHHQIELKPV